MKTTRSVMGALLAISAISAFTLSAPLVHAADDTRTDGSRNGKMKSDSRTSDHDSRSTGTSRSTDSDTRGTSGSRAMDSDSRSSGDGRTSDSDSRSVGDRVSDQALETKVKTALIADNRVKARKIEVEVRNKAVYLSGTVNSQAEADAAIATARRVSGVGVVNSKLNVGSN